jgi:hypothetical protein
MQNSIFIGEKPAHSLHNEPIVAEDFGNHVVRGHHQYVPFPICEMSVASLDLPREIAETEGESGKLAEFFTYPITVHCRIIAIAGNDDLVVDFAGK